MGKVYLCLGKNAEVPWYFERDRIHIWNVEELCYFCRENVWLLEPAMLTKELCLWVEEQCGLPDLAQLLYRALKEERPVTAFLQALFGYTVYYSKQETESAVKILSVNENVSDLERAKARGDFFLESGRYVDAIREYSALVGQMGAANQSFWGLVWYNLGVAQAKMFWFVQAAESFERSYKLSKSKEAAGAYLAAMRFALTPQEYVDFLARRPDFYNLSLQLEQQIEDCDQAYWQSENAAVLKRAAEARQNGDSQRFFRITEEKLLALQSTYKEQAGI